MDRPSSFALTVESNVSRPQSDSWSSYVTKMGWKLLLIFKTMIIQLIHWILIWSFEWTMWPMIVLFQEISWKLLIIFRTIIIQLIYWMLIWNFQWTMWSMIMLFQEISLKIVWSMVSISSISTYFENNFYIIDGLYIQHCVLDEWSKFYQNFIDFSNYTTKFYWTRKDGFLNLIYLWTWEACWFLSRWVSHCREFIYKYWKQ